MYWTSIALAVLLTFVFGLQAISLRQLLGNITMFQMAVGIENILDPYWTLFIELLFYIGCVILFAVGVLHASRSMRLVIFSLASVLILLSIWIITMPDVWYSKRVSDFITVGSYLFMMLLGHAIRQMHDSGSTGFPWNHVLLFVVVFVFLAGAREMGAYNRLLSPVSVFFSSLGAMLFFVAALRFHFVKNALLEFAGRISYSMYLLHGLALLVGFHFLGEPSDWWSCTQLLVLVLGLTSVSALLGFYLVEDPGIRIGKRIRRALGQV
jgi:peptidoglycan/LPS O-acetylase OafA/YrhL